MPSALRVRLGAIKRIALPISSFHGFGNWESMWSAQPKHRFALQILGGQVGHLYGRLAD